MSLNKLTACLALCLVPALAAAEPLLRDPTTPLVASATGQSDSHLQLQSIMTGAGGKLAIINGETVREGETLPGRRDVVIERIEKQQVIVRTGEGRETLKVYADYRISTP